MSIKKRLAGMLSAFVALVTVFAVATPAFAATTPQGYGTITISNATIGYDYAAYKVFDVTYGGDAIAYTIDDGDSFYSLVSSDGSPFKLTETTVQGRYNVTLKDDKSQADVVTWFNNLQIGEITPTAQTPEGGATSETVEFKNVPYGYYYITSSLGATVTVWTAAPNASVIDKNQKPGEDFKKTVGNDKVMQIGVPYTYTLSFTGMNYAGETKVTYYKISDKFPSGVDLVDGQVTVTIKDANHEAPTTLNYTVELDENRYFQVNIPWVDKEGTHLYANNAQVTVTYRAVLNASAQIEGTGETNEALLEWNGNGKKDTSETVYTYALALKKVNKDGTGLAGAQFVLKDKSGAEVRVSKVADQDGVYVVDTTGTDTITSPDSGVIVIKGVDDAEYELTETKAPNGYNLLKDSVPVTPEKTRETNTNTTVYLDAEGKVTAKETAVTTVTITSDIPATAIAVLNKTGSELPSTGGMGTTLLYAVGAVLVIGAGVTLVVRRCASHEA